MNLPNILTTSRIVLSPVFFFLVFAPGVITVELGIVYIALLVVFLFIELSDVVDGYIARRQDLVTDLGKVLDPFSDVISRVTYFLCFVSLGIMPAAAFLIILYREIGIIFIRMVLAQRGITLAARKGGKFKSVVYSFASAMALLYLGEIWFGFSTSLSLSDAFLNRFTNMVQIVFWAAAGIALLSFADYLILFVRELSKKAQN